MTRFDPDSAFLGIVLGYGATLMGYIYYGVPVGAGNPAGRSWIDTQVPGKLRDSARYWGKGQLTHDQQMGKGVKVSALSGWSSISWEEKA